MSPNLPDMLSLPFFGPFVWIRMHSYLKRLPLIIEQLGKLVTDDPSVIETTLEQYGELVHPDSSSVLQRYGKVDFRHLTNACCVNTGVRARVVDKDLAPKWDPPTLEKVSQDMVDQYFLSLSESEPDLELPTNSIASCRKWPKGNHHRWWRPDPNTASVGLNNMRPPQGQQRCDGGEGFAVVQTKKREKKRKKTKVIGPLTPQAKDPQARSYHGIAANGGGDMNRDTVASPELAKEKKTTKTRDEEKKMLEQHNEIKELNENRLCRCRRRPRCTTVR
ncbi:hypothetical protein JHK85_001398 [Glycine max]|nr:hypothetical protein JHK85_001398 [Glycine max]